MLHILLIGEKSTFKDSLAQASEGDEIQLDWVSSFSEAITRSAELQYDAALLEVSNFDSAAAKFLKKFLQQSPQTALMPISPRANVEQVVEAMRAGAADFILEASGAGEIMERVSRAIDSRRMRNEIDFLRHTQPAIYRFDDIVGVSEPMRHTFSVLRKVAPTDATVLIMGETGTGKELIAGAIHFNSRRAKKSFIKVNCAALPENLLESELFGHEKGAFTGAHRQRVGRFEQADGGSIFLDEIGDMGLSTQAKILRVLQEHQFERLGGTQTIDVDVRVIAATNKDITELMGSGQFREDLYYRLNVVTIELAPLRQRLEDIEPLVNFFLNKYTHQISCQVKRVAANAVKMLKEYHWPGNIRQLQNVIERAVIMCEGEEILPEHLALFDRGSQKGKDLLEIPEGGINLEDVERLLIIQALERTGWVQKKAAKLLGISPRVINYKIRKHHITSKNPQQSRPRE
jgi:DNA-binding NtrC family response regulator